jgi:hypothetical protein
MLSIALWLTACSSPTVSSDDFGDHVSKKDYYSFLAYAIVSLEAETFNQNFAGKPTGNIDEDIEGTYGGSIKVTGNSSKAADVNITIVDLTYTLVDVKQIVTSSNGKLVCNATMNGTLKVKGSFNESYKSVSFTSPDMSISGTMTYGSAEREINEQGSVSISASYNKGQTRGEVFGQTVSW